MAVVALEDDIGVEADLLGAGAGCLGHNTGHVIVLFRGKADEGTDDPSLLHREGTGGPGLPLRQDPGTGLLTALRVVARLVPLTSGTPSLDGGRAAIAAASGTSMALRIAAIFLELRGRRRGDKDPALACRGATLAGVPGPSPGACLMR